MGFIGPLGLPELLVILLILVLLFGARKIPDLARGLGEGIRNFRAGMRDEDKEKTKDEREEVSGGTEN